ncbi:hypothetical protein PoB_002711800 [Plakobranchus ocellatus]|uniref:Uncharacterized protein n=1 Tax=Plakobranchus ocellatus TaxID=259542 RepID=A0AAV4A1X8_9GAST|nr:hypothetical protein PoB_002711800 [Plakobranchus ocellatus]
MRNSAIVTLTQRMGLVHLSGKTPQAVWKILSDSTLGFSAFATRSEVGHECKQPPVLLIDPPVFSVYFDLASILERGYKTKCEIKDVSAKLKAVTI